MLEFLQSSYDVIKSYLTLASVKWMQIQVFRYHYRTECANENLLGKTWVPVSWNNLQKEL